MLLVQILSIFKERPQLAKFKYIKQFLEPVHRSFLNQFQKGNMEYLPVPKTGVDKSKPSTPHSAPDIFCVPPAN